MTGVVVPQDEAERRFLRNGVLVLVGLALLTVPFARLTAITGRSWILPANATVLAVAGLAARRERVPLEVVVVFGAVSIYTIGLANYTLSIGDILRGGPIELASGSSALWAAAVISPITFAVNHPRVAASVNLSALAAFMVAAPVSHGGRGWDAAVNNGLLTNTALALLCVAGSGAMASVAQRRARQRRLATLAAARALREAATVARQGRERRAAFARAADQLRVGVASLHGEVSGYAALTTASREADGQLLERLSERVAAVRASADAALRQDAAVDPTDHELALAEASEKRRPGEDRRSTPRAPLIGLAVLAVAVAASSVATANHLTGSASAFDAAVAGNRMIALLFVASAMAAATLRRRPATILVALFCLSHPVALAIALGSGATVPDGTVQQFVAQWRIAIMAAGLLVFLGELLARRARDRDAARAAQDAANLEGDRLRQDLSGLHLASKEAAHELQTPLTILQGNLATLIRHGERLGPETKQDLVGGLERASERLAARTELLLVASGVAASPDVEPEPVTSRSIAGLLADAAHTCRPLVAPNELVIDLHLGAERVRIAGDHLEHVLENLVTNALKYGDNKDPITVVATVDGDNILVSVTNSGPSLTPEDAKRMFDPWFRTDGAQERASGAGLGLAVVQRLVTDWGGEATCTPGDNHTTVSFTIPLSGADG